VELFNEITSTDVGLEFAVLSIYFLILIKCALEYSNSHFLNSCHNFFKSVIFSLPIPLLPYSLGVNVFFFSFFSHFSLVKGEREFESR
jgi:hypothetical protein